MIIRHPGIMGEQGNLDAVVEAEFGEDAGDIGLHGGDAEVEVHPRVAHRPPSIT